ncbi:hypothetical protein Pelo_11862 [Pelomyxa schiedti]|nr:hypothetical protein Pelo_11862 [Pelomyxa schiedti]
MCADGTSSGSGGGQVPPVASDLDLQLLQFAGVSHTVGVVELWDAGDPRADYLRAAYLGFDGGYGGWVDNGCALWTWSSGPYLSVLTFPTRMEVHKNKRWVVMVSESVDPSGSIAIWPVGQLEKAREIDVTRFPLWLDLTDNMDEAAFLSKDQDGNYQELCLIDLKNSYESSQLVITHTVRVSAPLRPMFLRSRTHKFIVSVFDAHNPTAANDVRSLYPQEEVLCDLGTGTLHKLDTTHFAVADSAGALSVFSTDDFEHPLRVFPSRCPDIPKRIQCARMLVAFQYDDEIFLLDALRGTLLWKQTIRHPQYKHFTMFLTGS